MKPILFLFPHLFGIEGSFKSDILVYDNTGASGSSINVRWGIVSRGYFVGIRWKSEDYFDNHLGHRRKSYIEFGFFRFRIIAQRIQQKCLLHCSHHPRCLRENIEQ